MATPLRKIESSDYNDGQMDILDRFYECAPGKPFCTDEPGSGVVIRSKQYAFQKAYVQHNPPSMCHWMTFDQDHNDYYRWKDEMLPASNLIVRNRGNVRCHISYAIESVCTSDAAKPKPMYYLEAIQRAYGKRLKSDKCYSGLITKNPLNDYEYYVDHIHDRIYPLGELADYVELEKHYRTRKAAANKDVYGYSRHCNLFDLLRFWSYDHVTFYRDNYDHDFWMKEVLAKAESYNHFPEPLPFSSIKSTAKSVGNWTWKRYFPEGKRVRRGLMSDSFKQSQLPLDLKKKQRLAARHTNEMQKKATEEKIIDAIGQLITANKKVTKAAVASITGIHRNSLSRNYPHLFKS